MVNSELVPRVSALVDIEDRGYQFGDGIYEVAGVYNSKVFKLDEHLARLKRSAAELRINLPYDVDQLKKKLLELHSLNPMGDGLIYIQVTRGIAPRVHSFPEPSVPAQLVAYTKPVNRPFTLQKEGVRCVLADDIRWLRCDIKSINLLGNVLAKQKAVENQAYEAIFHRGETVTEGSSTNVFIVKDGDIYTHPANQFILNGITRLTIVDICKSLNYRLIEEPFSTQQLLNADEVFITGTLIDVIPVVEVEGQQIGTGIPGTVTILIQEELEAVIRM